MERVSLRELMQATGGRLQSVQAADAPFDRVAIDSRDVRPGDVFWSIRGENHDGHDFTAQAFESRARLCVVSEARASDISGPVLVVDDTLSALGRFASWYRNQFDSLVIGVTGSVGKTTTRELIYAALGARFNGIQSRKNFNNLIGLPLSLFDLEPIHEFAVLEMGASKEGDIRDLCELARPEIGVITAIGPAHLQSFGSLAAIVQAKGELLEQLPTSGFAVLPGDDEVLRQMADRAPCPVIFVGQGDDNQIRATRIESRAGSLRFRCEGDDFDVPGNGRHLLTNALCAIAIGLEVGIAPHLIAAGLTRFSPVSGRGNLIRIGPWTVIDDTYNASPLSVAAACHTLSELVVVAGVGHRILVLGDMRELGSMAIPEHENIGRLAASLRIDRLLVCGDYSDAVASGALQSGMKPHQIATTNDSRTLLAILDCWLEPHDLLLVKGSRATKMECVIEWLKERARHETHTSESAQQRFCA